MRKFFAVTTSGDGTSLYELGLREGEGLVHIEKRRLRGRSSVKPGESIPDGDKLFLGLQLVLHIPGDKAPEDNRTGHRTSAVVALFLEEYEVEAITCYVNHEQLARRDSWMAEWRGRTRQVLLEIGTDHPSFEILTPAPAGLEF